MVEDPLDLGARKIRIQQQAGLCPEQGVMSRFAQLLTDGGRLPGLPDDRRINRVAALFLPNDRGLSLVRNANTGDLPRLDAGFR